MNDNRPVAVFDSGVGGLSVLFRLVQMLPDEDFIYLGDRKNSPYGGKSHEEVRALCEQNAASLFSMGAKALVIACNTATAASVQSLRALYPDVPIIGTEPAIKPAVESGCKRVLVLATPLTVREPKFRSLLALHAQRAEVTAVECPGLADMVERGECDAPSTDAYFSQIFSPYLERGFDAVVLGCTHYPFTRRSIERIIGDKIPIFDGSIGTARQTGRILEKYGLCAAEGRSGHVKIISSDGNDKALTDFYRSFCFPARPLQ